MSVVEGLLSQIALERPHQTNAVRRALTTLLDERRRGVVLADEVGCGKTYEALGIASLLWAHHAESNAPIRRILVLADGALMNKWFTEIELGADAASKGPKKGFLQYLQAERWAPLRRMLESVKRFETRGDGDEAGIVEDGRRQLHPDRVYITKQGLLSRNGASDATRSLRYLRSTTWDVLIVDEAHNYTGLHTQRSKIFFPEGTHESRDQGLSARYVLALTATPFQLATRELLNLLRVIHADERDLRALDDALPRYEKALESFYARRHLALSDESRRRAVDALERLRLSDASGGAKPGTPGLEPLLRRYVIRNVKAANTREYRMSEARDGRIDAKPFRKLDDVRHLVKSSALLPLEGPDAWVYMQVRDLIDDARALARQEEARRPTFVAGDLRQCLSSYEQLRDSALLTTKNLPRATDLTRTLDALTTRGHQHPKVRAICGVVDAMVSAEIERVRRKLGEMPGKILVFNTLMRTATTLSSAINETVKARLDPFLEESVKAVGWSSIDDAKDVVSKALRAELAVVREQIEKDRGARFLDVDRALVEAAGMEMKEERGNIVDLMFNRVSRHCQQPLFLLRLARYLRTLESNSEDDVAHFLMNRVTERLRGSLDRIVDDFLDDTPVAEAYAGENRERAIREIARLAQILASPTSYVARFDGETGDLDRERNKENFNRPYAPLVLIASRVGEEGIDLQAHTRFLLHYDVEWNPAKMEQREGRVDREGRLSKDPVRVQFFLLKDTYEERVFHTVMQRHLWFEVLIGSKKKELAKAFNVDDGEGEATQDRDAGSEELGCLTAEERERVMLNLEPSSSPAAQQPTVNAAV